jgi:hypothetical protein
VENDKKTFVEKLYRFINKNYKITLISIFLFGLILRIIVASNLTPVADEMVHGVHAIGISKLAPLSTLTQSTIWYYLTDYIYRIFGISLLTARSLSVIFGSLSIILVYLISNLLFNRKIALISSFLLAISSFHITWAASYQDQTMMFFILLASFFFLKSYKEKGKISMLSGVFLAIAELMKIISGVFIIVFFTFAIYVLYKNFKNNRKLFRENLNRVLVIIALLILATLPVVAYNLFLFKEKGIVDLPLAQFLRINPEFYTGPGLHHEEGFVLLKLPKNLYDIITVYFIKEDPLIFLLAVAGIIYLIKGVRKREFNFEILFLLSLFFFGIIFIASSIVLQTHYTSFFPLMALFSAPFIEYVSKNGKLKGRSKLFILIVLSIVLIYNLIHLHNPLTSQSATEKLRTYAKTIDENTLVLVDSRIYVGTYTWMFNDKHYLNADYLLQLNNFDNSTKPVRVNAIFVECAIDDCGWGTIKDQPELNASMEMLVSKFKETSTSKNFNGGSGIDGVRGGEPLNEPFYKVYSSDILVNPALLGYVDQTHNHFFYHIPRNVNPKDAFDYYVVDGALNKLLNLISYLILYSLIVLSVISITVPFYLLSVEKKSN